MDTPITPSSPRKRSRSLAQGLVERISERIRSGEFRPGDKLPTESEIVQDQGVSRSVVREAISQLQAMGLVETRHGIGTFVLKTPTDTTLRIDPDTLITMHDVMDMLELRISIEVETAALAAIRRSEEQLSEMRRTLDAFQANLETSDCAVEDFQFHLQVACATGNRYFADFISHLGTAMIPRTRIDSPQFAGEDLFHYLNYVNREHEDIYDAIARRDSEAARAAMRTHLTKSRERLRRAYEAADAKGA